ncbi:MAG: chaperonin GroEL [Firmicutes bacterium]|nr:chaperonin GroEL [Bacillota bacterium]
MIILSPDVYGKIGSGIDNAANAVKATMGPLGRNIAFDPKMDVPYIINSGREIVKHINFEDKAVMVGVDVVKQAMEKAFWTGGDGSVATAVLVQSIWNEAVHMDASGADAMAMMRGIRKASEVALEAMREKADRVEGEDDIKALAKCAAGGRDDIANIVTEVYDHIGPNGYVTVEDSQMAETHITYFKGVRWEKGFLGHFEEESIVLENPYVLLVNRIVNKFEELAPVLKEVRDKNRALLIIARELKDDVINALHYVRDKAGVDVLAVTAPGYGDVRTSNMKYFGIMFGATVFDDMMQDIQETMTLADCGRTEKVVMNKKNIVIQGIPNPDDPLVEARRQELYRDLEHIKNEDERYRIEQMLTPLAGDTAEVKVGGVMEMEMFERKYLVDNAIHNTYSALKAGFLPGGGKAFILAVPAVREFAQTLSGDERLGANILADALTRPAFQIAENAGIDGKSTVEKLLAADDKYTGLNVLTEKYENLREGGVLDSMAVIESALVTAVSSVSTAISVAACVVARDPEEDDYM